MFACGFSHFLLTSTSGELSGVEGGPHPQDPPVNRPFLIEQCWPSQTARHGSLTTIQTRSWCQNRAGAKAGKEEAKFG